MIRKTLYASPIALLLLALATQSAIAQPLEFPTVKCYFFEGEKLSIENTCGHKVSRWAGGGVVTLTQGIRTRIDERKR
jgi:hypothetical protein